MQFKRYQRWMGGFLLSCLSYFLTTTGTPIEASQGLGGPTHIGTFEGSTTFTTSSSNGINPGLYLEVMDRYGNYTEYTSEDGVITLPDTEEGAYITQAKLLGKTMYRDQDTGELLDTWEEGRNLQLESVKMPVLTTTGKNLFDNNLLSLANVKVNVVNVGENEYSIQTEKTQEWNSQNVYKKIKLKQGEKICVHGSIKNITNVRLFKNDFSNQVAHFSPTPVPTEYLPFDISYTATEDCIILMRFWMNGVNSIGYVKDIMVEIGEKTPYEPYKSNILSCNEEVTLRGIGDVKDELNVLTGELTQRIGIGVYDGSEDEGWNLLGSNGNYSNFATFISLPNIKDNKNSICDKLPLQNGLGTADGEYHSVQSYGTYINILSSKASDVVELKNWLSQNNLTIYYPLATESVKTVVLTNTYNFQPVMNREVRVEGTALPLICSVTVPTETLSFVINPNEKDVDQQFIAPEFEIVNEAPASIQVTLKEFEQVGSVFHDVLPETHTDWSVLTKEQSKDLALALNPMPSTNWVSLTEVPRYVANSQNVLIGEVKPKSSVRFTFSAKHGLAFTEQLNSNYRLSFIFDF